MSEFAERLQHMSDDAAEAKFGTRPGEVGPGDVEEYMNEPVRRQTEVIVNHRIGYWGAPDGMTVDEVAEADAYLEAHIQWRIKTQATAGRINPAARRPEPVTPPEADATPDEAFELGRIEGYDEAKRESVTPETVARIFHEAYEVLAPSFGYETRKESAVEWDSVPEQNKSLMIAVAGKVLEALGSPVTPETETGDRNAKYFHDGWTAALREIRLRGDRAVGEFLVEQLGEPVEDGGDRG